jgi:hypothetical protein
MNRLLIFALAIGAICAGAFWDRRANTASVSRPDLDQWEGEGGAAGVE